MAIAFIWDEKYNVGDKTINKQHQQLFKIGNEIQYAKLSEAGKYVMKLLKYTKNHFAHEEAYMKKNDYPELEQHKEMHDELIIKLGEISSGFINNEDDFAQFKSFVYEWLTNHILHEDKKFFEYEKGK